MFAKTVIALLAAFVLNVACVSAQAQSNRAQSSGAQNNGGRNCVSMEEGARSAYPAWRVC